MARAMTFATITAALALATTLATAPAEAAFIIDPTTASAVDTATGMPSQYSAAAITRTTDYSGLSGSASTLATGAPVPTAGSYPTDADSGHTGADYLSNNDQQITITYDLGAAYNLGNGTSSFHLYNYNEGSDVGNANGHDRGVQTASVYVAGPGASLSSPLSSFTLVAANQPFANATGLTTYQGDDYSLLNGQRAEFVRFVVTANYSNLDSNQGSFTGLGEIRFIGAPVPEPGTVCLLAIGAVGLLYAGRRRKIAGAKN